MSTLFAKFPEHFSKLTDPRVHNHNLRHKMTDILMYVVLGVICGADNWVEIEEFAKSKEEWLRTFLELPNGIASHDIIGDLFSRLDAEAFNACFVGWIKTISKSSHGRIVPIDGKTLRGSYQTGDKKSAIHIVNAWCDENNIILGQYKTEAKSNEITAIPHLLNLIDVNDAIVTIDAMGCQKKIAEKIIEKGGDYILAVKGNQPKLYEDLQKIFASKEVSADYEMLEEQHGRIENRRYWTSDNIDSIRNKEEWKGLQSVGMVQSNTLRNGQWQTENRYYINSIEPDVEKFSNGSRKHWGIENKAHWVLDVSFSEDKSRVRKGYAAENLSLVRKIGLAVITQDKTTPGSIAVKRKKAGWSNRYLEKLVGSLPTVQI